MQYTLRNKISIAAVAGVMSLMMPGISLADYTGSNSDTGADSSQNVSISDSASFSFSATNNASTDNNVDASIVTGRNTANANTGDGTAQGGDAALEATAVTESNINGTVDTSTFNFDSGSITLSNENTGADSENDASVTVDRSVSISQNNQKANIVNDANIDINTGGNEANRNTGDGEAIGGDARVRVRFLSQANINPPTANPSPSPTPGNGGGGGGGGTTVTPPTSNGGGQGGGPTPVTTTTTTTTTAAPDEALGQGGGMEEPFTTTLETVIPRGGIGGGFFPAGSNWLIGYLLMAMATGTLLFSDKLRRLLRLVSTA